MNIDQLKSQAEYAYEHAIAKKNLQQRLQARLNVSYNGGFFTVTKELICFLNMMGTVDTVLIDDYQTPVKVNSLELCRKMTARYQEIMNEWADEYETLKKKRTIKDV